MKNFLKLHIMKSFLLLLFIFCLSMMCIAQQDKILVSPTGKIIVSGSGNKIAIRPKTTVVLQEYYVAKTGNDNNTGESTSPFLTITKGVSMLSAGKTLYIKAGTYAENLGDNIPSGSSWITAVTVRNYSNDTVVIRPPNGSYGAWRPQYDKQYIILYGLILDGTDATYDVVYLDHNGGLTQGASYIRFRNCTIQNAASQGILASEQSHHNEFINCTFYHNGVLWTQHGLYIHGAYNLIDSCTFYQNSGWGAHLFAEGSVEDSCHDNVVRNSLFHDNGQAAEQCAGMGLYGGDNNMAYNNILYHEERAIVIAYGATNTKVYNNTMYGNYEGIQVGSGATNTTIKNNIVYLGTVYWVEDDGTGTIQSNNWLSASSDPQFADSAGKDFRLVAPSGAIDSGATLTEFSTDRNGVVRPRGNAWDIGAYEHSTVYFVANSGNDATGNGRVNKPWQTVSKINGLTFQPGDSIFFKAGDTWREELVAPSSGASNLDIVFARYGTGTNPIFNGSSVNTGAWTQNSNVWSCTFADSPYACWFNGTTRGVEVATSGDVNSANKWAYVNGVWYVYSVSNPGTTVEAVVREYGIKIQGVGYITAKSLDVTKAYACGINTYDWNELGVSHVTYNAIHAYRNEQSGLGMYIPYGTLQNCASDHNGHLNNNDGAQYHGYYLGRTSINNTSRADNYLIENCTADSNTGWGFHFYRAGGGTIRYCFSRNNGNAYDGGGGIVVDSIPANKTTRVYYNVVYGNVYRGMEVSQCGAGDSIFVYNNTLYDNAQSDWGAGLHVQLNNPLSAGAIKIKNNLIFYSKYPDFQQGDNTAPYDISNNLYYRTSGNMIIWNGTTYAYNQFTTYQSASGDTTSLNTDPLVTNTSTYDFTLQGGSACINAGIDVGLTRDILGNSIVVYPDIGAYESSVTNYRILKDAAGNIVKTSDGKIIRF
jgi:parallel beta-helix repeat protein